jgi:hypothetical protein
MLIDMVSIRLTSSKDLRTTGTLLASEVDRVSPHSFCFQYRALKQGQQPEKSMEKSGTQIAPFCRRKMAMLMSAARAATKVHGMTMRRKTGPEMTLSSFKMVP